MTRLEAGVSPVFEPSDLRLNVGVDGTCMAGLGVGSDDIRGPRGGMAGGLNGKWRLVLSSATVAGPRHWSATRMNFLTDKVVEH